MNDTSRTSVKYKHIPKFILNLDLDPRARWTHIISAYKNRFAKMMDAVDTLLTGIKGVALRWLAWYYAENVYYIDEIRSISEISGIEVESLILLQLCYEMFACCTSVAIDNGDGSVVHYRTMDWEMPELAELTIHVDFIKNNKKIFSATTWAGYVGVMTGVKHNVCSVALNYRRLGDSVMTNLGNSLSGAWPIGFLIRSLLESEDNFDTIKTYLKNSSLISPCYITLCGTDRSQGVVISRTREGCDRLRKLCDADCDYLVQTNIDDDKLNDDSVPNIVYSKQRVKEVSRRMRNYRSVSNIKEIMDRFNVHPIINETTIYVTVMSCSDGSMYSYV